MNQKKYYKLNDIDKRKEININSFIKSIIKEIEFNGGYSKDFSIKDEVHFLTFFILNYLPKDIRSMYEYTISNKLTKKRKKTFKHYYL